MVAPLGWATKQHTSHYDQHLTACHFDALHTIPTAQHFCSSAYLLLRSIFIFLLCLGHGIKDLGQEYPYTGTQLPFDLREDSSYAHLNSPLKKTL